jgi:hypothetical protein
MGIDSTQTWDNQARDGESERWKRGGAGSAKRWALALILVALPSSLGACDSGFSDAVYEEELVIDGDFCPSQVVPHRLELAWCPAEGNVEWTLDFGLEGERSAPAETVPWTGWHSFFMLGPHGGAGSGAGGSLCGCGHGRCPCGGQTTGDRVRSWRIKGVMPIGTIPTEARVNVHGPLGFGPTALDPEAPLLAAQFVLLPPEKVEGSACAPIPVDRVKLTVNADLPCVDL